MHKLVVDVPALERSMRLYEEHIVPLSLLPNYKPTVH